MTNSNLSSLGKREIFNVDVQVMTSCTGRNVDNCFKTTNHQVVEAVVDGELFRFKSDYSAEASSVESENVLDINFTRKPWPYANRTQTTHTWEVMEGDTYSIDCNDQDGEGYGVAFRVLMLVCDIREDLKERVMDESFRRRNA